MDPLLGLRRATEYQTHLAYLTNGQPPVRNAGLTMASMTVIEQERGDWIESKVAGLERIKLFKSEGAQAFSVVVFQELHCITRLVGLPVMKCWYGSTKTHLSLWYHGVHHRDITPTNLVYKTEGDDVVGILIDFDLEAGDKDARSTVRCTGTDPPPKLHDADLVRLLSQGLSR